MIDPARWSRVEALFEQASGLPPDAREAWLDDACAGDSDLRREVASLLAHDLPDDTGLDAGVHGAIADAASIVHDELPPLDRVGPYRIVSEIGRGGMGAVYLAERDDEFHQRVAIKLMRGVLGGDGLRRFRAERRILAPLQHPNIARLLDGGTTPEGMPYLVMEYVEGQPIDRYCDRHHLGIRQRLTLFRQVCDAVSHAHRGLVVHRDIKPSNIVVTPDGTPKLLDFGIAKLLDDDGSAVLHGTQSMRLLTPEYASPEQVRGEPITTASDVYSLGVLLFELLSGERPHRFETRRTAEIERVLTQQEAPRPSTVVRHRNRARAREITGDLDTIVLTALQKDAAQRYPSVEHLAEDLQRYLEGHPVMARRPTWRYRATRFVRRHRLGAAAAAAMLVISAGFVFALSQFAARAARERDAAERTTGLLVELFSNAGGTSVDGRPVDTAELLTRGAERIKREMNDQPQIQRRVLNAIGSIFVELGQPDRAEQVLHDAVVQEDGNVVDSAPAQRTMFLLAQALRRRGQFGTAEPIARASAAMGRRVFGRDSPQTAQASMLYGEVLYGLGRAEEAERVFREASDTFRNTLGPEHPMVATGLNNIARSRLDRGDITDAEHIANEALLIRRVFFGQAAAESEELLGEIRMRQGRPADAEPFLRNAVAARRLAFPRGDATTAAALDRLAAALVAQGKQAEAASIRREAEAVRRGRP